MTENVPQNLVSVLIKQHRGLQNKLGLVLVIEKNKQPDFAQINKLFDQFKLDLTEHLELENTVFYKELLKKMKKAGQDTAKTEEFITQMDIIGQKVNAFLAEFSSTKAIEVNFIKFKNDFETVVETLSLRIESEEAGVYSYWDLF